MKLTPIEYGLIAALITVVIMTELSILEVPSPLPMPQCDAGDTLLHIDGRQWCAKGFYTPRMVKP